MTNKAIQLILIILFIFTPIAFGSMELWAFSLMELGILLIIVIWAIQKMITSMSNSNFHTPHSAIPIPHFKISFILFSLFLIFILFQLIPIPLGIMKIISPKTYELRHILSIPDSQFSIQNAKFPISFVPFATKVEFFRWLTLIGLFLFLLFWRFSENDFRVMKRLVVVIFLMGVFESLYGMFEFFSGHRQILYLKGIAAVSGTFINRNYFAGYLLMVIPLSMGFLFSRKSFQKSRSMGWRQRLSALEGKTVLIAFGVMVMILALLFSASRMGILSLLLSFSLISILFRNPRREKRFSKTSVLILGLALLWRVWIGLDAVISRFFSVPEDFKTRWMIWVNTFKIIKDFPVLGSGLGTFGQIFPMYRSFHIRRLVTHAENDFLQLSSDVGLVGVGLLLILFIFFFIKAVSGIRSLSSSESQRYIGIGGLVGILALMFHSLVERNLQVPANAFLFTFIWALVFRTTYQRSSLESVNQVGRV
jgi:O-antigen ligase